MNTHKHMFSWRNKKNIIWITPLICSYANVCPSEDSDQSTHLCSLGWTAVGIQGPRAPHGGTAKLIRML